MAVDTDQRLQPPER
jgi:hypothetical protein